MFPAGPSLIHIHCMWSSLCLVLVKIDSIYSDQLLIVNLELSLNAMNWTMFNNMAPQPKQKDAGGLFYMHMYPRVTLQEPSCSISYRKSPAILQDNTHNICGRFPISLSIQNNELLAPRQTAHTVHSTVFIAV